MFDEWYLIPAINRCQLDFLWAFDIIFHIFVKILINIAKYLKNAAIILMSSNLYKNKGLYFGIIEDS